MPGPHLRRGNGVSLRLGTFQSASAGFPCGGCHAGGQIRGFLKCSADGLQSFADHFLANAQNGCMAQATQTPLPRPGNPGQKLPPVLFDPPPLSRFRRILMKTKRLYGKKPKKTLKTKHLQRFQS
jgi:hypothetical protein